MNGASRPWLFWLLVVGAVVAHAAWLLQWVALDGRLAPMACCDLSGPVSDIRMAALRGAPLELTPWSVMNRGGMSWLAVLTGDLVGWHEDVLLFTQVGALALAQLAMFWALRPIAPDAVRLVAAVALPLVPGVAFFSRQWTPYPLHGLILLLAFGALVRSRSLTHPAWMVLVVVLGWAGWILSPMLTDDILFVSVFWMMVLAAVARGLVFGQGPLGAPVARAHVAVGSVTAASLSAVLLKKSLADRGDFGANILYYLRELGVSDASAGQSAPVYTDLADPLSLMALTAYPRRLFEMELGPVFGVLTVIGLWRLLQHGRERARAELLGVVLGPLLVMSLVAKKQAFYVYLILPFVPALAAMALIELRDRARWVGWTVGVAALAFSGWSMVAASQVGAPQPQYRARTTTGSMIIDVPPWQLAAMQMPYAIRLAPQQNQLPTADAFLELLKDDCQSQRRVVWLGHRGNSAKGEPDTSAQWKWRMTVQGQCLDIEQHAPSDRPAPDAVVLSANAHCSQDPSTPWARDWERLAARADWKVVRQRTDADGRCQQLLVHGAQLWEKLGGSQP